MTPEPGQTGKVRRVLFGLVSLSVAGLAEGHGAPTVDGAPPDIIEARITHQPALPGFRAMILEGPRPGILMRYQGNQPVTVLGTGGEPFLRFTGRSVMANPNSPDWQALPNRPARQANEKAGEHDKDWVELSRSGSFGWLDPRLYPSHRSFNSTEGPLSWSITLRTASGDIETIAGELTRRPLP